MSRDKRRDMGECAINICVIYRNGSSRPSIQSAALALRTNMTRT